MDNNKTELAQATVTILVTEYKEMVATYRRDTISLIKASIELEGIRHSVRELKEENANKDSIISILKEISFEQLEMFEKIFDSSDGDGIMYEDMAKYLKTAEYMEHRYGRRTNYIRKVKEKINELHF